MAPPLNIIDLPEDILQEILRRVTDDPAERTKLKTVCRGFHRALKNMPVFLSNWPNNIAPAQHRVAMAMAPVNSSGDIYHMAAYVILALHYQYPVPPIFIGYDAATHTERNTQEKSLNTGDQETRALAFVAHLGLAPHFHGLALPLDPRSTQPTSRQKALRTKLSEKGVTHYIDHRFSTTAVAASIKECGFDAVTQILRRGFLRRKIPAEHQDLLTVYATTVEDQLTQLASNGKPMLVIHYRDSSKANSAQDLSGKLPGILIQIQNTHNIVVIHASGKSPYAAVPYTHLNITPFIEPSLSGCDFDLGKLAHIDVFNILYEKREAFQLRGVVGNTSGTLDVAAMMGHRVLNIHHFLNSRDEAMISYQSYRILIQLCFLSVLRSDEPGIAQLALTWINSTGMAQPKSAMQALSTRRAPIGLDKIGFQFFCAMQALPAENWIRQDTFRPVSTQAEQDAKAANLLARNFNYPV